jgi:hypothetical protein
LPLPVTTAVVAAKDSELPRARSETAAHTPARPIAARLRISVLIYLVLLGVTLATSWHDGAFHGEFGDYPDEAAHYVTGLMFHDYLVSLHYLSPIKFAENYYIHYPKVAIGHWPPVFYLIQGIWELFFSASLPSLMILMAALTSLLALAIYQTIAKMFGHLLGIAAALSFVGLPLIQNHTTLVMADISLALFSFAAAVFFGRYLESEKSRDASWFGVCASMAILTKGSALALALLPAIAIPLSGKWHLLRKFSLWISAVIVFAMCGPWYWLTRHMQSGTWVQPSPTLSYSLSAAGFFSLHFFKILGWPLAILALLGFAASLTDLSQFAERKTFWASMTGLFVCYFVLSCVIPVGKEERYILPVIPAALAFAAAGVSFAGSALPKWRFKPALLSSIFLIAFIMTPFRFERAHSHGFAPIAQMLVSSSRFHDAVLLISSDADGEGMMISEVAMREKRPGHLILRASKALASGDWTSTHETSLFQTPEQVEDYLDSIPVSIVILDHSASLGNDQEYEQLLEQAIISHQKSWTLLGSYPIWRRGKEYPQVAEVYGRSTPAKNARGLISIDMTSMLGKTLKFELQRAQKDGAR